MALIQTQSNTEIEEQEIAVATQGSEDDISDEALTAIAGHIRGTFQRFRRARTTAGIDMRIQDSLRAYNGRYTDEKLSSIKQFGGSEVYSRLTSVKCRGTTAMLRDIFLGTERPWGLKPTSVPEPPADTDEQIDGVIAYEISQIILNGGTPPDEQQIAVRRKQLQKEIKKNIELVIQDATQQAEDKLQDILEQGGFYQALNEFIIDLPIYPYAVIKGPVVRMVEKIEWEDGDMVTTREPQMFWERVDPINIYYTPGASSINDADVIERMKLSRSDISKLIGVKGYKEDAVRAVLEDYDTGLTDWLDQTDTAYSDEQSKESPQQNLSGLIDGVEFSGYIKGSMLIDYGIEKDDIPDEDIDYAVTAWLFGRHVIKVTINKNPRRVHNYYLSSFEKVPGSISGHGLPEIIEDIQDVANATFRSLVNNMSIASGPQVAINEDMLSPTTDADSLYPWKRWRFNTDPLGNNALPPISFFQPDSHSTELLGIYQSMAVLADEISAIPRYMTGSSNMGGAGSTASGLSMLMNNASKVLQNIAANIDRDIMMEVIQQLYMNVMLTDTSDILRGDEEIIVQGVSVAQQRETDRMRQLEFLNITNNETDMSIIGKEGRAAVLRPLANNLGLPGEDIVPKARELADKIEEQDMMAQAQAQAQAQQGNVGRSDRPAAQLDNAQRTRSPQTMNRALGG